MSKRNIKHYIYKDGLRIPSKQVDENTFYLIGTPYHTNIGDRAIAYAEIDFISRINKRCTIIEVPFGENISNLDIKLKDTIILHGGGNFGDLWPEEEEYRQQIVSKYTNNKIVVMPQTIFFKDINLLKDSASLYSKCRNLTIIAREKASYDILKKYYNHNKIILIPDIVLSLYLSTRKNEKRENYALFVTRNDIEKTIPDSFIHTAEDVIKYERHIDDFIYSDMHCNPTEAMVNSHKFITEHKLMQFKRASIVVTDRLHGMIFAVLTGTPCIVFGSKTQKTVGVYELLKQTRAGRYVELCEKMEDISPIINKLSTQCRGQYRTREFNSEWKELSRILKD